jgi:hypothetical protein
LAALRAYSLWPFRRGLLKPLIDAYVRLLQGPSILLDRMDFRDSFSWNHLALARKTTGVVQREPSDASIAAASDSGST